MFFKKILVAVDDSAPSQYAVEMSLAIASLDSVPVTFAIALDPSFLKSDCAFASLRECAEQIANELVTAAKQRAQQRGVEAASEVFFDSPADGIIGLARAQDAGLIVIGTHGRSGIMGVLFRSLAEEVLRHTTTPLCVIRRPPLGKVYRRVLVPVVDDDLSATTISYAIDFGRAFDAELVFCTVHDQAGRDDEAFLESANQRAREARVASESVLIPRAGNLSARILQKVHAEQCDVIVMASHARDGLERLVKGSVAETIIRSSTTPVVVLRNADGAAIHPK
ncbi:MAG TPA: universal stress protein [Candidatus Cybelea sp.]|nr:universal stress protein [Candidatus Cybelea sp.]